MMAKRESNFINMLVTLFAVTFIASASLGLVNEFTRDAIKNANAKAQEKAIASVLPNFDKLGKSLKILPKDGPDSLELFPAYDARGNEVGTAVKTYTNKGFSGHFTVMVGFKPDGTISGYEVLQHQETPGLGSKMGQWFRNKDKPKQDIIGKNPGKVNFHVSKDGGDIDAITAATISSRAFLDAVRRAYNTWKNESDATIGSTTKKDDQTKGGNS
ncbi:electron transport complex subunit G [Prolixibacter bellariivorans]|uniref:Ion-translocating oxidoreductase complex subunit G n=1 Tax=Prolixibacter bellariivorans TaxID=314319 RepID=A0A5M4B0K8_9BACT|nr:RnfABCDGE type electron transport complex subunit G [Prolixibacter bellariivorans]GET33685.1 electron transport complex subunit G [Prolixibacter bellariivorans]